MHGLYEDFLLTSAWWAAELCEERLLAQESKWDLDEKWENTDGWQQFRQGKTDTSVDRAKAMFMPELAEGRRKAEWLIARLGEQIDRLERDAAKVSRAFKISSGE